MQLIGAITSGVARVSCALGKEVFLRLLSTKTAEFEMKIGTKVRKKQKQNFKWSYFTLF